MPKPSGVSVKQLCRKVRILIADNHPVIRKAVRATLQVHPHFEVCGEAMDGAQAVEETKKLNPDVVVLNVTMPVMNGFEAARRIRTIKPESAIVILSSDADQRFVDEAKKLGVRAYVAKTKAGEALIKSVEAAIRGEDFVVL
jgi:DNA-binding NarL/FixJ family response regulator